MAVRGSVLDGLKTKRAWRISPLSRERFTFMAKTNPLQFVQQVRSEMSKVVWPGRREVVLTTAMVLALAAVVALFFSLVDWGIRSGLAGILGYFG